MDVIFVTTLISLVIFYIMWMFLTQKTNFCVGNRDFNSDYWISAIAISIIILIDYLVLLVTY